MAYKLRRQRNNTSGLVGLRLRHRSTRTGLRRYFIEVSWQQRGQRAGTSFPVSPSNFLRNTARALLTHVVKTGQHQVRTPEEAWALLVRGYRKANRRG